jgi:phospholipase C
MFYSKIFLFIYLIISFIKSHNITNVVVLMLENRSFDHMCGFLKQTYSTEIDGLNGNEYNLYDPENPNSKIVFVNDDAPYIDPNPGHQINDVTIQIFGKLINNQKFNESFIPPMNGFVKNAFEQSGKWGPEVMSCFNEKTVPVISTLAKEFAIFDKWFSSVPGPTDVNRMYVHSATSHGCTWNDPITLGEGYPQKTIYETLYEEGYSFKIYCEEVSTVLFFKNMRYSPYIEHFKTFYEFLDDSKSGNLPHYSFIEPRYFSIPFYYANDQHPSHDVSQGELLIKQVYEALRASPQWNSTLLIVTYDEHGGFYDHYPTPLINVPNPDGINGANPFFEFNRLGVRVPTLLISPWINKAKFFLIF